MKLNVIIPAAGLGTRMGKSATPKQFLEIEGIPVVYRALLAFRSVPQVTRIIVATRREYFPFFSKVKMKGLGLSRVHVVAGGKRRVDSVERALKAVEPDANWLVIHDAARPFVHPEDIGRVIRAAMQHKAAILARPMIPTVKEADASGFIKKTVDRNLLRQAETPQVFERKLLFRAYKEYSGAKDRVTDEAFLVEQLRQRIMCVEARHPNLKITTRQDLKEKEIGSVMNMRVGNGFDIHRLVQGRQLTLGGVKIPFPWGTLAHSDGDVFIHAIIDALLGAACGRDIGELFPDTSKRYKNVSSLLLLKKAKKLVDKSGFQILNVDAVIICEKPTLLPYKAEMISNVAEVLDIKKSHVSVKAKTKEGLDSEGQGFSISCHAVALLAK